LSNLRDFIREKAEQDEEIGVSWYKRKNGDLCPEWSSGQVSKAETYNHRTHLPERDGIFCCKVFGPIEDYKCLCEKYEGIKHEGKICDKCGVEVTKTAVRAERLGHIQLVEELLIEGLKVELIPVIPPPVRTDELNYLYLTVINRNRRLGRLREMKSPKMVIENETQLLREGVKKLIEFEL